MSYDDFLRMDFDAFEEIHKAYEEDIESEIRGYWERARWHASVVLSPYYKNGVSAESLLPLPWDKEKAQTRKPQRQEMTAQEQRERMKRLVEQFGDELY